MHAELEEKSTEIIELNNQLSEACRKIGDFESQLKSAHSEVKDARKEKCLAIQAKIVAEQNMTSIEYEYEQHKARSTRREKELIEQLESVGNDEAMNVLKEKLATMTEKANSLETQLWQDSQNHNTEIESLNTRIIEVQAKLALVTKQADKLKNLQNEYDEVSVQLVDCIQENDQLKIKCKDLEMSVEKLNEKISKQIKETDDLNVQISTANANDELKADLEKKKQDQALKMWAIEEKHRREIEALEEQKASQLAKIQKLEQIIADHSDEIKKLEENHHIEMTKSTQKQTSLIQELEQDIVEQKDEIFNIKSEHDDLLAYCNNLEHTNTLLGNACTQARMTVDLIMKETELLRKGYNDLKMSTAVQELEHLKLQRTISEYDDSVNFSVFNDTVSNAQSICNNTQSATNNTQLIVNECEDNSVPNNLTIQLQKANEERDSYASRLGLILKRLTNVIQEELSDAFLPEPSEDQILDKLKTNLSDLK